MPQIDDISSSEKLLRVIRDSKAELSPASSYSFAEKRGGLLGRRLIAAKGTTVGVDIGYTDLKLVRIHHVTGGEYALKDYLSIPFPEDVGRESPRFARFLQEAIQKFGGVAKKEQVWCSMSSARVEVGHITIPKVGKNQIANAVQFTVKKQNPFDEGKLFLDFEVQGEIMENGISRIRVLYYIAPAEEVNEIKSLFAKAGVRLTGIAIGPFANQNLFRTGWVPAGDGSVGSLYMGRNWSRIDVLSGGNLVLTRGIKTGINSMVEAVMESFNERVHEAMKARPAEVSAPEEIPAIELIEIPFEGLEGDSTTDGGVPAPDQAIQYVAERIEPAHPAQKLVEINRDQARKILFSLSPEMPRLQEGEPGFDLSSAEKFALLEPAAERLVRQVERTFEHYATTLGFERVRKIFVSGGIDGYRGLAEYIGDELGMEREMIDPMDPGIPGVDDRVAPESMVERASYIFATGLALSDNARTPNLIFPYEAKERVIRIRRFNNGIFAIFLILIAAAGSYHLWQNRIQERRQAQVAHLEKEVAGNGTRLDKERILEVGTQLSKRKTTLDEIALRYLPVAVLGDISLRTPEAIRLLSAKASLGTASGKEKPGEPPARVPARNPAGPAGSDKTRTVAVEGLVFGDPKQFDAILAAYLVKLETSPLLRNPKVEKIEVQKYKEKEVLRFTLTLEVV